MCTFPFLSILCEIYLTDLSGGRENDAIFKSNLDKLEKKIIAEYMGKKRRMEEKFDGKY